MEWCEPPHRPMWLRRARARASLERAQGGRGQWLRSLLLFTLARRTLAPGKRHNAAGPRCPLVVVPFVRRAARSPEVAKARAATLKAICNISCQTPHVYYWHAELGAGGKDYRADFVHAPFPKILSSRMP